MARQRITRPGRAGRANHRNETQRTNLATEATRTPELQRSQAVTGHQKQLEERQSQRNVPRKQNMESQNIDKANTTREAIARSYQVTVEQKQPELGTD